MSPATAELSPPERAPGTSRGPSRRRRRLLLGALALLGGFGLVLLIGRLAGYRGLLDRLQAADPVWLLVAVCAETASLAGFTLAVRAIAVPAEERHLHLRTTVRLVFASLGAARAVVGGGPAGIALFYWGLCKAGAGRHEAAARVVALYGFTFAIFGGATWLCALAVLVESRWTAIPRLTLAWLLGAPAVFALAASARPPQRRRLAARTARWLWVGLADLRSGVTLVRRMLRRPRNVPDAWVAVALYWLGDAACLWTALHAFGFSVEPSRFAVAYSTAYLATLLPLPFGGIGSVEAVATVALRAVGVPVSVALLGVLAYRSVNFWLPTLPGLASFATLTRLGRRLEREGTRAAAT